MKIIPFEDLYHIEFIISEPFSKEHNWFSRNNFFSSINSPKPSHTLLWLKNCSAKITDKYGNSVYAKKNQILYTAKGAEYSIEFFDTAPDQADTIVVHFQLRDTNGNDIAPADNFEIAVENVDISLSLKLQKLADEFKKNIVCVPDAVSVIYRLFAIICKLKRRDNTSDRFNCIKEGIELLENDTDMSIKDIAKICNVSECYFRRMFKEYSGESPIEFRQKHRIEKAKQLLSSGILTIGEISRELYFSDIYHFSKTFKSIVGVSPKKFTESNKL